MAAKTSYFDAASRGLGLFCTAVALLVPGQVFSGPPSRSVTQVSSAPYATLTTSATPTYSDAFIGQKPSLNANKIAGWVIHARDNRGLPFAIVDKHEARVFIFNANGEFRGATPALMGSAVGDDSVAGIGERKMSAILPHERTTPAGRFLSEPGVNAAGEDIVWVDYDAAVSMHRVRANVPRERRLQRLASATADDNRISFGCINLPANFYESFVKPTLGSGPGVVYVLPETRTLESVFDAYRTAAKR